MSLNPNPYTVYLWAYELLPWLPSLASARPSGNGVVSLLVTAGEGSTFFFFLIPSFFFDTLSPSSLLLTNALKENGLFVAFSRDAILLPHPHENMALANIVSCGKTAALRLCKRPLSYPLVQCNTLASKGNNLYLYARRVIIICNFSAGSYPEMPPCDFTPEPYTVSNLITNTGEGVLYTCPRPHV